MYSDLPFSKVTHVSPGEVRVPPEVLEQPNSAIKDLLPGQWAFGQEGSLNFDMGSNRLVVDSYDPIVTRANVSNLDRNPAIARVSAEVGGKAVLGYIANISCIRNFLNRGIDLQINNLMADEHRLIERQKKFGTQLISGLIYRDFGDISYIGLVEFEDQAAEFSVQFNSFADEVIESNERLKVPTFEDRAIIRSYNTSQIDINAENPNIGST